MYCDYSSWFDFNNHAKDRRLIIFGAGNSAKKFISLYAHEYKIEFIVDNDPKLWGKYLNGIPVFHIAKLKEFSSDEIVVLICGPFNIMRHELVALGIYLYYDYILIERNKFFKIADLNRSYTPKYNFDYSWTKKANSRYAHALGTIDNIMYTNSLEAFEYNYKLGYRAFEADIFRINDGTLLLSHIIDTIWTVEKDTVHYSKNTFNSLLSQRPWSIEKYKNEKVFNKYTPLTTQDFLRLMSDHQDIYFITHTQHEFTKDIYSIFTQLVQEAMDIDKTILDRFVLQVYDEYMLDIAMSVYPFKCANLLQYEGYLNNQPFMNNIDTCLKTGIKTVTLPVKRLNKEIIEKFNSFGISVCTYFELYGEDDIVIYKDMGVEVFCVDLYNEAKL